MQLGLRLSSRWCRIVVAVTILSLVTYGPIPFADSGAQAAAEIHGAVLESDGLTAVAGAVVKAAHLETLTVYQSEPTPATGVYRLPNLPAGSYDMAVETTQGVFVSSSFVQPEPGKQTLVSFSLRPPGETAKAEDDAEEADAEGEGEAEGTEEAGETEPPPEPPQQQQNVKQGGFFKTPGGAALIIVITGGLLGAAANSATKSDTDLNIPSMTPGS